MAHAYEVIADFLKANTKCRPQVGIICGSGLAGLSNSISNPQTFHYSDIPGFPNSTVAGHSGELVFGTIGEIPVVCMKGRFHFYEGNSMETVVLPVRVMRLLGVKMLIVTNAAGGLNPSYNVGDIVVIQDHFGMVRIYFFVWAFFEFVPNTDLFNFFLPYSISPPWEETTPFAA
jgi:purine-nucleoside phosphorylase